MRELRAVALSEDGGYLVLADIASGPDAEKFRVPVDDRLRAALRGARRSEVRQESALTPREIQARLRAGETAAEVARVAGIPVERVERYEGPVLAERARVVQEARAALLPKDPGGTPGRPLGEVVDARLMAAQDDPDGAQWDAWRRVDGIWLVQLTSESRCARWTWDPVVRRVRPHDDAARALVAPETPVDPAASAPPSSPTPPDAGRPAGPALTLVQHPPQQPTAVPQPPTVSTTPVVPSVPPQTAGAPVAVPPPTPIQPAAARGRTHGASRPTARVEASGDRAPATATPLAKASGTQGSEPAKMAVAPGRNRRPAPGRRGPNAGIPTSTTPGSVVPDPVSTDPVSTDLGKPGPDNGVTDDGAAPATTRPGTQPRTPPDRDPESGVEEILAQQPPTAGGHPGTSSRTSERAPGGRRGRKPVPAWDDIVFGARRP